MHFAYTMQFQLPCEPVIKNTNIVAIENENIICVEHTFVGKHEIRFKNKNLSGSSRAVKACKAESI